MDFDLKVCVSIGANDSMRQEGNGHTRVLLYSMQHPLESKKSRFLNLPTFVRDLKIVATEPNLYKK
jgi:hypothetical protein